jgi:hypothetical protein
VARPASKSRPTTCFRSQKSEDASDRPMTTPAKPVDSAGPHPRPDPPDTDGW